MIDRLDHCDSARLDVSQEVTLGGNKEVSKSVDCNLLLDGDRRIDLHELPCVYAVNIDDAL